MSEEIILSLNTLELVEAAASLQGSIQALAQGQFSLPKPALPESQGLVTEMTREESPSVSIEGLRSQASGVRYSSCELVAMESGLSGPNPRSSALR